MIQAKLAFVAEGVTTDRDSNKVSAFNFCENIEAESYPLTIQKIAFFCLWERTAADPGRCGAEFSITHDGSDIVRQPVDIDFEALLRCRCTIHVDGFTPQRPGTLVFRLAMPGHDSAEWVITAGTTPVPAGSPRLGSAEGLRHIWDSGQLATSMGTVNLHLR